MLWSSAKKPQQTPEREMNYSNHTGNMKMKLLMCFFTSVHPI